MPLHIKHSSYRFFVRGKTHLLTAPADHPDVEALTALEQASGWRRYRDSSLLGALLGDIEVAHLLVALNREPLERFKAGEPAAFLDMETCRRRERVLCPAAVPH